MKKKIENKNENKHIGWITFWFVIMFGAQFVQYVEAYEIYAIEAIIYSAIDIAISTFAMMFVPCVIRIARKEKMPYGTGVTVCIINSVVLFILSIFLTVEFNIGIIGGLGAIIFYNINKWVFVDENTPIKSGKKEERTNAEELVKCSNCGALVGINDKYCFNCNQVFDEEIIDETEDIDSDERIIVECSNCGAEVDINAKKCSKCGQVFDETIIENEEEIDDSEEDVEDAEEEIEESSEDLLFCSNCGMPVMADDTECINCGEKLVAEKKTKESKLKKTIKSKDDFDKKYEDLKKLKELYDDKVLTKEEFDKEKKKILNENN